MKQTFAGVFLTIGFVFLVVTGSVFFKKNPSDEDRSAALGGLIVGVPAIAIGGWLILGLSRNRKNRISQQSHALELELESTFLRQLQLNQGRITPINLALSAKISLKEAEKYLETKSIQLNGTFDIDEEGHTSYHFDL